MTLAFTIPNQGLAGKMEDLGSYIGGQGFALLFTDTFSDLTTVTFAGITQPTFPGYSSVSNPPNTITGIGSTLPAVSVAPVTFTCAASFAGQTITGVAVGQQGPGTFGNALLAVALLPSGPQVISQPGDSLVFQCNITDQRV